MSLLNMNDAEIPCKYFEYCGNMTKMLGTKMCDGCWELETRIRFQPQLAAEIMTKFLSDRRINMSNMSYCRFQNTERDVFDCQYALEDLFNNKSTLSADELEAAKKLVGRCADLLQVIVDMADIDDDANLLEEIVDRARGELDRANAVWENEYARLIGEYQAWMREQGLNLGSADEHLTDESLTDDQRTWLKGFVEDWEEITLQEHDAQRREK